MNIPVLVPRIDGPPRQSRSRDEVERLRSRGDVGPRALMAAVLRDAIVAARWNSRRAERWIRDEDWEWPFSFNNICLALDLNRDRLRGTIFRAETKAPRGGEGGMDGASSDGPAFSASGGIRAGTMV